jgi:hypothetical protein
MSDETATGGAGDPDGLEDDGRRAALVKMGKFAGLTAPAVVTLLTVDAPEAWAGSKPGKPKPKPK